MTGNATFLALGEVFARPDAFTMRGGTSGLPKMPTHRRFGLEEGLSGECQMNPLAAPKGRRDGS